MYPRNMVCFMYVIFRTLERRIPSRVCLLVAAAAVVVVVVICCLWCLLNLPSFLIFSLYILDAAVQIGRSLVRFQTVSLEFFIDIILPIAL